MNTTLNGLRTAILILVSTSMLTGCGAFSTIRDAVLPDFSDEELENPMASFVPATGGTAVANPAATSPSPMPGIAASSAAQPFDLSAAGGLGPVPGASAPASTGLMDQSATTGVSSADAALLDAALDLSPSEMGTSGASSGLVAGSIDDLVGFTAPVPTPSPLSLNPAPVGAAPTLASAQAAAFQVLSQAEVDALVADGSLLNYTNAERADLQTPYFTARQDSIPGLSATIGATPVGTSPGVTVNAPLTSSASVTGASAMGLSRATLRTNQAAIPVYGGAQTLALQPHQGTLRPGFAQFRSGSTEFTLTFPAQVAVSQLYSPTAGTIKLSMRNVGREPISFQPENLLNQFPPFEIYRRTGSSWASLTLDVAYNLDRQGIAAPVTLQPGETRVRTESFSKIALMPLVAPLPATDQLAIRLQVSGQGGAFGSFDSGYIPIIVTDSGAFPSATNLTSSSDPGFVLLDGSDTIPGTILSE
jgi:hypothetical protein